LKRAQSELLAAMLLAAIVLGALTWLVAQWEKGVGNLIKRVNEVTVRSAKLSIRIDCSGNYLVFLDPTVPSVIDAESTEYNNLRYCYAELGASSYKAYFVLPFYCNGEPSAYFIFGTFSRNPVDNVTLYTFKPSSSSAVVPQVACDKINFMPFATLHIVFPDSSEKVVSCFTNITLVNGEYLWGVSSCVGA